MNKTIIPSMSPVHFSGYSAPETRMDPVDTVMKWKATAARARPRIMKG